MKLTHKESRPIISLAIVLTLIIISTFGFASTQQENNFGAVSFASTAPQMVGEYETQWDSSVNKTTSTFSVQPGDLVIAYSAVENETGSVSISGGNQDWNLLQKINSYGYAQAYLWATKITAAKSMAVTFTSNGTQAFGGDVLVFRGSDGIGATAKAYSNTGSPKVTLTTTRAHSAIITMNSDWDATIGSNRAWLTNAGTINETTYAWHSGKYTVYGGYYPDAASTGAYQIGLSSPSPQIYSIVAAEIRSPVQANYSVNVSKSGSGAGVVTGTGINCGTQCTTQVTGGTSLTLTAKASTGSSFAGWSGACTGKTATCTVSSNANVNAVFNDTVAPTRPTGLSGVSVSSSQINISWTASNDAIGVKGYRIYRCDLNNIACTPTTQIATVTNANYSDINLVANMTYRYSVAAFDAAGNLSAKSGVARVRTQVGQNNSGPLLYWKFNEGSGTIAQDSTSYNRDAALMNGAFWASGVSLNASDYAIGLDGVNDYANAGDVDVSPALTISLWMRMNRPPTAANGWATLAIKEWTYGLEVYSQNAYFGIGNGSNWSNQISTPISLGQWIHLVGVYDGSSMRLYKNGVLAAGPVSATLTNSNKPLLVGSWDSATEYFTGSIDEVQIYNRALSATEVKAIYAGATPPTIINGICGSEDGQTYPYTATAYATNNFCQSGTPSPNPPAFPQAGNTSNWTCVGSGTGHTDAACSATRETAKLPTVTLTANPNAITSGQSSALTWSSANATSCTGTNFSTANATSGSVNVSPTITTTYSITCTGPGGNTNPASATVTVNSALPVITITAPDANAAEPTDAAGIRIVRTGDTTRDLNITYSVTGTATSGSDYAPIGNSVTMLAGRASVVFSINPIDNNIVEPTETVIITITANPNYSVGNPSSATVIIADDDSVAVTPTVTLTASPETITQGQSTTLTWTSTNATSCTAIADNNFAGTKNTSGSQIVTPAVTTNYTMYCTGPAGASLTDGALVTVTPPAIPTITITTSDANAGEPNNTGSFTVFRTGATTSALTVSISTGGTAINGTDYTSLGSTVIIASGSMSAPITITPIDDALLEGSETVTVTVLTNSNYMVGAPSTATITLIDNETSVPNIPPIVTLTANPATATAPATIALNASASDTDGIITKVDFNNGSTLLYSDTNAPYSYSWAGVPAGTYSITATAFDNAGAKTTSSPVAVMVGMPVPVVTLTASPGSVTSGGASTLTWGATNTPTSCTATTSPTNASWNGTKATSGSQTITNITQTTTFTLTCINAGGTSNPANTIVTALTPAPTATLTTNPSTINSGSSSTLTWSSTNATSCTGTNFNTANTTSGSATVSPTTTTNYSISCTGPGGTISTNASLTVIPVNNPPIVSLSVSPTGATAPATITLTATASDADGAITKVDFNNGSTLLYSDTTVPYSYTWSSVAAGTYSVTATAYDNQGARTTTPATTITINSAPSGNNVYVKPSSTGTGSGADWTNAIGLGSVTFQRGKTYYLASGNYTGASISTPLNGTDRIIIKKATDSNHGTSTGWVNNSASYGLGKAVFSDTIGISTGFVTLDGQSEHVPYGIEINVPDTISNNDGKAGIYIGASTTGVLDGITIRYLDIHGPHGDVPWNWQYESRGIEILPWNGSSFSLLSNMIVEYNNIHALPTLIQIDQAGTSANNLVFQYNKLHDNLETTGYNSDTMAHQNMLYLMRVNGVTFRYNEVYRTTAVGYYPTNGNNNLIYGNVFHDITGYAVWVNSGGQTTNVYNNTFVNVSGAYINSPGTGSGQAANNLFYNTSIPGWGGLTSTSNITATAGQFVNVAGGNYQLTGAIAGTALSATYNKDMNGITRGADGVWDVGAFEYVVASTNVYVRPTATGNGSGSDWGNALGWNNMASTAFVRGKTYYLADGSYSGKTLSTAASGSTLITIKKAIGTDHGTSTGWSSTDGDGQATFSGQLNFTTSYWLIDGQTGGGPGNWNGSKTGEPYGFKVTESGDGNPIILVGYDTSANNITIRHIDLQGKGSVSSQGGYISNDGLGIYGDSSITLSYAWMHGVGRCPFFIDTANSIFEYLYVQSYYGSSAVHSEIASIYSFAGVPLGDITFRNSLFTDIKSTGGLMWDNHDSQNAKLLVYGNVFYKSSGASWESANGLIGGWTGGGGEQCRNVYVYNNTFIDTEQGGEVLSTFPNTYSGLVAKNNLFYSVGSLGGGGKWTLSSNHFISTTASGSNTSTGTGIPFTNYTGLDFTLTGNTAAGENLGAPYNIDMLGNTRTTWTRGAIEYTGPAVNQPPTITSFTATPASATAPATITLSASASDTDGTISKIEFYNGATLLGTDTITPYSYSWANVAAGNYSLTAKAYDDDNASVTSGPVSVTVSAPSCATCYFVTPSGAGTTDGSSWANAFAGFSDIAWGTANGQVGAGDTLYVGAGTYSTVLTVGASGTSNTSRVNIRAAQDTQTGTANFNGGINYNGNDYVTIDGNYNGARNFTTNNYIEAINATMPVLKFVNMIRTSGGDGTNSNSSPVSFQWSANAEIAYNYFDTRGSQYGAPILLDNEAHTASFGQASFHHNIVIVPGKLDNEMGPDGMHAGDGYDIYDNNFMAVSDNSYSGTQHQDLIQAYGDEYLRIYNNSFTDSGGSMIDISASGNTAKANILVYNNVFRRTITNMGTVMLRMYTDGGGVINRIENIHIANNTFIDGVLTTASYGAAIRIHAVSASPVITNSSITNNIIYNSGDGWPAVLYEGGSTGWSMTNNLINKGSTGNAYVVGITDTNRSTTAPQFMSYTPYSVNNDYNLSSLDTGAKDKGKTLTLFTKDKKGTTRPQGTAWDIGAYEYQ